MLILTRCVGESVKIGHDVVVTVLKLKGNQLARLGIDAPKNVAVHREEIFEQIKRDENERIEGEP